MRGHTLLPAYLGGPAATSSTCTHRGLWARSPRLQTGFSFPEWLLPRPAGFHTGSWCRVRASQGSRIKQGHSGAQRGAPPNPPQKAHRGPPHSGGVYRNLTLKRRSPGSRPRTRQPRLRGTNSRSPRAPPNQGLEPCQLTVKKKSKAKGRSQSSCPRSPRSPPLSRLHLLLLINFPSIRLEAAREPAFPQDTLPHSASNFAGPGQR